MMSHQSTHPSHVARLHRLNTAVTLAVMMSGCAGSSHPNADDNRPTAASQLYDPRRFTVLMEWDIPFARTNGDPLYANDLSGYEIQYSSEQERRVHSVRIKDPLQTQLQLPALVPGDYQFTIAAIESGGHYGQFAPAVTLTLQ